MEDCVYYDMKSAIPQIGDQIFVSMNQFSLLNQIAAKYQAMADPEQMKYKAALEAEPYLNLEKALDIALHLPDYELSYLSKDADDFFKEYLSYHLKAGFDRAWLENTVPHPDSQMLLGRLGATQTDYGIISARGQSLYRAVSYEESPIKALSSQALTDEKLDVVEVLGQTALFTNGRVTEQEVPEGLYRYDLREGETLSFSLSLIHI